MELQEQLKIYENLLLFWNQKINLTAIKDPEEIKIKHFEDSLSILKHIDIPIGESIIYIGTGAGFPGMVLKLARPDLNVTLLDGHKKRFIFLEDLQKQLDVYCTNVHGRAEEAVKKMREQFFIATARAVAPLNILSEYCLPYVKLGGYFIAMKAEIKEELEDSKNAIKLLGGEIESIKTFRLSDQSFRTLIFIKKISQTPPKYPRISAKILKQPL